MSFLTRLPTFIVRDVDKKVTVAEGYVEVRYMDVFSNELTMKQESLIFTEYAEEQDPMVRITFGSIRFDPES